MQHVRLGQLWQEGKLNSFVNASRIIYNNIMWQTHNVVHYILQHYIIITRIGSHS